MDGRLPVVKFILSILSIFSLDTRKQDQLNRSTRRHIRADHTWGTSEQGLEGAIRIIGTGKKNRGLLHLELGLRLFISIHAGTYLLKTYAN